jgi:hypothetical protein
LRNDPPPVPERECAAACGRRFVPHSTRQAYCSDACRQRGFRRRQRPLDELLLGLSARVPHTSIVYQCPECETRLLGQQRCEDCGVFARRLGPGAPCPQCDEPLALADLLAELQATLPVTIPNTEVMPDPTTT